MTVTEFLVGRTVERQAVTRYVNRHENIFKGHTKRIGKELDLDAFAVEELEKVYPLPAPAVVITGVPQEEYDALKKKYELLLEKSAAQGIRIGELSDWKAEKALEIAAADQTKLMLEGTRAELEEEKKLGAEKTAEIDRLKQELTAITAAKDAAEEETSRVRGLGLLDFWKEKRRASQK